MKTLWLAVCFMLGFYLTGCQETDCASGKCKPACPKSPSKPCPCPKIQVIYYTMDGCQACLRDRPRIEALRHLYVQIEFKLGIRRVPSYPTYEVLVNGQAVLETHDIGILTTMLQQHR